MAGCCGDESALRHQRKRVLWVVLAINAVMFVVEFGAGWAASSTALLGDSLDMLGDALVYGLSLFAVARGERWIAISTAAKGAIMGIFGVVVLAEAARKLVVGATPEPQTMAVVAALALSANLVCAMLLMRHRSDDINMRSAWVCSRNDLISNTSVLVAAGMVALTGGVWPDLAVGLLIAAVYLRSAAGVLRDGMGALRERRDENERGREIENNPSV